MLYIQISPLLSHALSYILFSVRLSAGLYPGNPFPVMMPDEVSFVIYQSASIGAT